MRSNLIAFLFYSFIACFGVDANATHLQATGLVEEPTDCLSAQHFPCAIRVLAPAQVVNFEFAKINLSKASTLLIYAKNEARLLEGSAWIRSQKEFKIRAGISQFSVRGDSWVEVSTNEKVLVRNLIGIVNVESPLLQTSQTIPTGFENWYSNINSDLALGQGILRPIEVGKFLPAWVGTSKLTKALTLQVIDTYKKSWQGNVQASAQLYQDVVHRQMASMEQEEESRMQQQKRLEAERAKLKQMFRARFENGE